MNSLYQYCTKCGSEQSHKVEATTITCIKCGKSSKVLEREKFKKVVKETLQSSAIGISYDSHGNVTIKEDNLILTGGPGFARQFEEAMTEGLKSYPLATEDCTYGTGARAKGTGNLIVGTTGSTAVIGLEDLFYNPEAYNTGPFKTEGKTPLESTSVVFLHDYNGQKITVRGSNDNRTS